jgi:hypothetical protein
MLLLRKDPIKNVSFFTWLFLLQIKYYEKKMKGLNMRLSYFVKMLLRKSDYEKYCKEYVLKSEYLRWIKFPLLFMIFYLPVKLIILQSGLALGRQDAVSSLKIKHNRTWKYKIKMCIALTRWNNFCVNIIVKLWSQSNMPFTFRWHNVVVGWSDSTHAARFMVTYHLQPFRAF